MDSPSQASLKPNSILALEAQLNELRTVGSERIQKLETEKAKLRNQVRQHKQTRKRDQSARESLAREVATLKRRIEGQRQVNAEALQSSESLAAALREQEKIAKQLAIDKEQLREQVESMSRAREEHERILQRYRKNEHDLSARMLEVEGQLKDLEQENGSLVSEIETLVCDRLALAKYNAELKDECSLYSLQVAQMREEMGEYLAQRDRVQNLLVWRGRLYYKLQQLSTRLLLQTSR